MLTFGEVLLDLLLSKSDPFEVLCTILDTLDKRLDFFDKFELINVLSFFSANEPFR